MDLIREWILRVSGIIVLAAACDIIMLEGVMKKYIKPILGFVLILAIIRPISGKVLDRIEIDISEYITGYATELSEDMAERQRSDIKKLYEKKLADNLKNKILSAFDIKSDVTVVAEGLEKGFGRIKAVNIELIVRDGEIVNTEEVRMYIAKELDTKQQKIAIFLKGEG